MASNEYSYVLLLVNIVNITESQCELNLLLIKTKKQHIIGTVPESNKKKSVPLIHKCMTSKLPGLVQSL